MYNFRSLPVSVPVHEQFVLIRDELSKIYGYPVTNDITLEYLIMLYEKVKSGEYRPVKKKNKRRKRR